MSEKILNGDFSSDFDYWDNGIADAYPYVMEFGVPKAASIPDSTDSRTYKMKQDFSVNDEAVAAKLTVWGKWICWTGDVDGYVKFKIELEKPDTSKVTLLDETKTPPSSLGNLLDEEDITAHFDQYGNYKFWLTCEVASCRVDSQFYTSHGYYDNINLNVAVKKYKSVHEKIGGAERLNDVASVSKKEIIGLVESYSTEVRPMQFTSASEAIGLIEGMTRVLKPMPTAESISLVERIQAKRTHGNLVTTYTIEDLVGWDEVSPIVTPWIKTKIIT